MLPGETRLKEIADRVLGMSRADQTEVLLFAGDSALTRFANSYIHQNVEDKSVEVSVRAVIGKKIGVAATNILSDESLSATVGRAAALATHQKENEDFQSLPAPRPVRRLDAWVERTATYGPDDRASVVATICDAARAAKVTAAGAFQTSATELVVANSLGIFAYHRETNADINATIMSSDGSGYAARLSTDAGDIDGQRHRIGSDRQVLAEREPGLAGARRLRRHTGRLCHSRHPGLSLVARFWRPDVPGEAQLHVGASGGEGRGRKRLDLGRRAIAGNSPHALRL